MLKKSYFGIKKGVTYEVKVAPVKKAGNHSYVGQYSNIKRVYAAKSGIISCKAKGRSIVLKSKKVAKTTGYDYVYSRSSKFVNAKHKVVKGASNTVCKIRNLKKNKTYYVKVRPYKTKEGKRFYGAYSATQKVKVR